MELVTTVPSWNIRPTKQVLVTNDLLMEGIHFDLTYVPMKHLGYKAAMVNLSDIYAMNGIPRQMVVSIALGKRFCVEDMEAFYDGIKMACEAHEVDIVGGDTTSSLTGLAISITCIGEADKDKVVYRNGAKETDLICVSGDLGTATWDCSCSNAKKPFSTNSCRKLTETKAQRPQRIIRSPTGL